VQVATQTAALLLARRDELPARTLELGGQADGVHRGACLPGEARKQLQVGRRQLLVNASRRDGEPPDLDAAVKQGTRIGSSRGRQ
jgi:hypothetical protein